MHQKNQLGAGDDIDTDSRLPVSEQTASMTRPKLKQVTVRYQTFRNKLMRN